MTDGHPSVKWLSSFCAIAHSGSIQTAADQTRLSISTVSHRLKCLEDHLGVALVDHSSRPMVLTANGAVYLRYAEEVLELLTQAQGDISSLVPHDLRRLRFAMIEDFESDIGPEITRLLAGALPKCHFTQYTRMSHEILSLLRDREVDIGIATHPPTPLPNVHEYPLLRDPFVLAVPATATEPAEDFVEGRSDLPFLRYMRGQIMGDMIEAQLTRMRLKLENRFELDSTSSIMKLISQNGGWAITTPSNYARSKRFHTQVRLLPFPRKSFARTISMFVAENHLSEVAKVVSTALRSQLATQTIGPIVEAEPWLVDSYRLIND
ncbi:LysR family transcriptional regulator [uncultured Litoreibacter sp.]|uniref:LysR family transcriptional regulator n=1 Tax=uncultured Litoreibacter sp. TaxID=1392394 RepID=UPI0026249B6F|nr:LysR family transcriptional regulator [uncultured Litoreibacter sp.]